MIPHPHAVIVMAATLLLATTTVLCDVTTSIGAIAFAFSSTVTVARSLTQQRRRRRRQILSPSPSTPTGATTTITARAIIISPRRKERRNYPLHSSENDDNRNDITSPSAFESVNTNNPADDLINKARRLREEISVIESAKLQAQLEKNVQLQEKLADEEAVRQKNEQERLRYSAIVPILKDMGEEVMERVDFPPRVKGSKYIFLLYFVSIVIFAFFNTSIRCF